VATMDVLPFVKTVGQKPACYGLNSIGLKRKGFDADRLRRLDQAYRILVRSKLNTLQAMERLKAELASDPDVDYLIAFVDSSQRGIHKSTPRGGGRGGGEAE
jgi:UDP-N-acetylglucosamine acyltransferase